MAKHTPGNWQISQKTRYTVISDQPIESDCIAGSNDIAAYGGYLIAESVAPENLPLIAAAPSLLEAAEEVLYNVDGWLTAWRDTHAASDEEISEQKTLISKLAAAIAHAKGEA